MLNFQVQLAYVVVALLALVRADYVYETRYFDQQVDHFGYGNQDIFSQRYLIASKYWNETKGPIFFYTGNEGDIVMFANNTGFMWDIAPQFEALLIFAEHRYYGLSMPYGNQSYSRDKIGYFTTEQALADYATLIYHLKKSLNATQNPVVAFGGSYGGMLAAWMRMKYPHIVVGALASSAPVLQFGDLTPCGKFAEIVTYNFAQSGAECAKSIRKSWDIIRKYGATESGAKRLASVFHLCNSISTNDIDQLINWLASSWQFLAMTNYPYATNFLLPLPPYPVKESCKYLVDSSESDKLLLYHIFEAVSIFQNYTGEVKCFDLTQSSGKSLGETGWNYQSCSEMVMPMCQDGISDMFDPTPWNFTAFAENCEETWKVKPDLEKAIIMYGGENITSSSNIIFSNGKLDPWSAGGFQKSVSDTLIAILIDDAAHHLDLRSRNKQDPESVIAARKLEIQWIKRWLTKD